MTSRAVNINKHSQKPNMNSLPRTAGMATLLIIRCIPGCFGRVGEMSVLDAFLHIEPKCSTRIVFLPWTGQPDCGHTGCLYSCLFLSVSALDLAQNSNVQDAFVIAVEQQARERLERLSALKRIKPVDMTKLSQQVSPV